MDYQTLAVALRAQQAIYNFFFVYIAVKLKLWNLTDLQILCIRTVKISVKDILDFTIDNLY